MSPNGYQFSSEHQAALMAITAAKTRSRPVLQTMKALIDNCGFQATVILKAMNKPIN